MNPVSFIYTEALYRPLLNLLVGITNVLPGHSMGWAIITVTFIVRLILLPSSLHHAKQLQSQQGKMKQVRADIEKIKKKYKHDRAKQAEETMRLYREAGINPASGCLPLLVQLPILIALYRVFLSGLAPDSFHLLYEFVAQPTAIDTAFFGISLHDPSLRLGILAGLGQYVQMKWLSPQQTPPPQPGSNESTTAMMASMQKNMAYIFPAMTVFIALQLPAALALYWVATTLFGIVQQYVLKRTLRLSENPPPM